MGVVYQQLNRLGEAEKHLEQAIGNRAAIAGKPALENVRYWALLERARDLQAKGQTAQARDSVPRQCA